MAARYEIGDPDRPRGHALLYFTSTDGEILGTYVVVLPIAINPAKYIPPAFASRISAEMASVAATALPPIPEQMGSLADMKRLAHLRHDDLLDGGVVSGDAERLMLATHEIANDYATRYRQMLDARPEMHIPEPSAERSAEPQTDEDELRWMLQEERERIGELAKLTGQLRYAVDGGDTQMMRATAEKVDRLRRHLPEKYRIPEFLVAAQKPGEEGARLAALYIDRCYKLSNEQYETLADIDREIDALEKR